MSPEVSEESENLDKYLSEIESSESVANSEEDSQFLSSKFSVIFSMLVLFVAIQRVYNIQDFPISIFGITISLFDYAIAILGTLSFSAYINTISRMRVDLPITNGKASRILEGLHDLSNTLFYIGLIAPLTIIQFYVLSEAADKVSKGIPSLTQIHNGLSSFFEGIVNLPDEEILSFVINALIVSVTIALSLYLQYRKFVLEKEIDEEIIDQAENLFEESKNSKKDTDYNSAIIRLNNAILKLLYLRNMEILGQNPKRRTVMPFEESIHLAYKNGTLDKEEVQKLKQLNELRNKAVHEPQETNISKEKTNEIFENVEPIFNKLKAGDHLNFWMKVFSAIRRVTNRRSLTPHL